ncbi:hypothetical protein DWW55_08185 [Paraprevotella clara]|jgi:hypothetical protein|nr:hypothetical protein DWW55_08185 [Paraprevotella clara]
MYSVSRKSQLIGTQNLIFFFNEKDTWLTFCHLSAFSVQQEGKVASVGIKCSAYGICREVWPEI